MAYTTIDDPTLFFETLIYTGDGNSPRSLTGLDFQPDLVWGHRRDDAAGHNWMDSVRGAGVDAELQSNSAGIEGSGNANTQLSLSSTVASTATNYLVITVTTTSTSERIFGALVTIS